MMRRGPAWVSLVVGALLALLGLAWMGQGTGLIPGSVMSGSTFWAVIGLILLIVGGAIVARGLRVSRPG